jgi:hypothetical protein
MLGCSDIEVLTGLAGVKIAIVVIIIGQYSDISASSLFGTLQLS